MARTAASSRRPSIPGTTRSARSRSSRESDATSRRPLGADGHFYRRQVEGFADAVLTARRCAAPTSRTASPRSAPWSPIARSVRERPAGRARRRRRAGLMRLGIFAKTFPRQRSRRPCSAAVRERRLRRRSTTWPAPGSPRCRTRSPRGRRRPRSAPRRRRPASTIAAVSGTYNMIHPDPAVRAEGLARLAVLSRLRRRWARGWSRCAPARATRRTSGAPIPTTRRRRPGATSSPSMAHGGRDRRGERRRSRHRARTRQRRLVGRSGAAADRRDGEPAAQDRDRRPRTCSRRRPPPSSGEIVARAVDLLGDRIVMAHAKDRAADGAFAAAGQGVLDYPHYFARAAKCRLRRPAGHARAPRRRRRRSRAFLRRTRRSEVAA